MRLHIRICVLILLLCAFMMGCTPTNEEITYTVYEENGSWYIKTNAGLPEVVLNARGDKELMKQITYKANEYSSLSELREKVIHNHLGKSSLRWLQFTAYPDNPIPICDMDALYEPVFPDDLRAGYVILIGDCLKFPLHQARSGASRGEIYIYYDRTEYQALFKNYKGGTDAPRLTFDGEVPNEQARALLAAQGVAVNNGALYYELDAGDGVMYVCEPPANERTIEMFGEKDDVFFRIVIHCQGVVPTVKWLSQFSIRPYEEAN